MSCFFSLVQRPVVNLLAGWSGLAAAKTYIEVHPGSNVIILESASSVGGVWAKERLYYGLKSNNMLGTYEYSDFPMDSDIFGVKPGQHIPGDILQRYFEKYAEHFQILGKIRLNSKVETAEQKLDGGWRLIVTERNGNEPRTKIIEPSKLIMATGLTSEPFLPTFSGQDTFGAPLFHPRHFLDYEPDVLQSGKHVTVFGGTKSAWDVAYACASSGVQVDWVIRESGHGPTWMVPPYVTPLKKWLEKLVTTRFLTFFSPCVWGEADGFLRTRKILHGTWLGRKIVDIFWSVLGNDVITMNGYDNHPETKKLKPWISPFWIASGLSILNYPKDIFEYVRNGQIRVHIADITHLEPGQVHLSTGDVLSTNALVCATGWRATPNIKFLPEGIERELGFPWSDDTIDDNIVKKADAEILDRFPRLRDQPVPNPNYKPLAEDAEACVPHPYRLARFMVPPSMFEKRSIAFLGIPMTINTALVAQTQALWAVAYLGGDLTLSPLESNSSSPIKYEKIDDTKDSVEAIDWETALHTEFGKFRYPGGFGKRNPDFVFDALPYIDMLLGDLGLRVHRKSSLLSECFEPYGPADYRGLIDEWKAKHR